MAGYYLYSLDPLDMASLVEGEQDDLILSLAENVTDQLDLLDGQFEELDPVADWPSDPHALLPMLKVRLNQDDWYGDLSVDGKQLWSSAISDYFAETKGFVAEGQCYWDVIEFAWELLQVPRNTVTEAIALSAFGTCPYRYTPQKNQKRSWSDWQPYHSMHSPESTARMLGELQSIEQQLTKTATPETCHDYEDELMPVMHRIVYEKRMLFVGIDT
ncbi:hypothetical protein [Allorhodopirellula heiligendammensis]|uniref:Uncharacterized protein n=1 Tax=Allorhodopirellula heiligendammensis TaxID=2714739 RepID=A0A5C6BXZ3_9BACT|nr:hypothetical protein [Allorhodopirellula heiligendammensis]TWU16875.1 hypothetical protein Poly21_40830 [Allorhodopirellula heiligendammensis]|tara:strand:+ start:1708 stop:2355 length:648 start_codon:yes stop_codon:yes gene_type:complete